MNIRCGNCGERHGSVYVVKTCYQISDRLARADALLLAETGDEEVCGYCGEGGDHSEGWKHKRCYQIP